MAYLQIDSQHFFSNYHQIAQFIGQENIHKIAMPIIGCGLDRLEWDKVSRTIKDVFQEEDIEILVCRL